MDVAKYNAIKDRTLRPWTINDPLDAAIREQCYELNATMKRMTPYKKGGGYGISSLDRRPTELIEIEKLLLNLGSYPVTKRLKSSSIKKSEKLHSAGISNRREHGEAPTEDENSQCQNIEHAKERESRIQQIPCENNAKSNKHCVTHLENASVTVSRTSIYGTTRRKISMKSATCTSRKKSGMMNTSLENFNRFLARQGNVDESERYQKRILSRSQNNTKHDINNKYDTYEYDKEEKANMLAPSLSPTFLSDNDVVSRSYQESKGLGTFQESKGQVPSFSTGAYALKLRKTIARPSSAPSIRSSTSFPSSSSISCLPLHQNNIYYEKNKANSESNIIEKKLPQMDLGFPPESSEKKKEVLFLEPESGSTEFLVTDNDSNNNNDNNNKNYNKNNNNNNNNLNLNFNKNKVRPSTANVRTKNNENYNLKSYAQDTQNGFPINKNYDVEYLFDERLRNEDNNYTKFQEINANTMDNVYTNNTNNNDNNFDNKNEIKLRKKPLQPFWEKKKIEKENALKELKKIKYWDTMETPLVDRVKTPDEKDFSRVVEDKRLDDEYPVLGKCRVKEIRSLRDKMMTTAGLQTCHAHVDTEYDVIDYITTYRIYNGTDNNIDKNNNIDNKNNNYKSTNNKSTNNKNMNSKNMNDNNINDDGNNSRNNNNNNSNTDSNDNENENENENKEFLSNASDGFGVGGNIFSHSNRESILRDTALSRNMVDDIKSKNTYDHLWGVLTTPGFLEVIGPEKFYKSEMNLSHSFSPEFKKALKDTDLSLGIKMDPLRVWTDGAATNGIKAFTPSGVRMKFRN